MAEIKATMTAKGTEPQTCHRPFRHGEQMAAVEYANGEPAGWHTSECILHWKEFGEPKCMKGGE